MKSEALIRFIRTRLEPRAVPCDPALRFHAAHPGAGLARLSDITGEESDAPYWAHLWPGGAALMQHFRAHPETVAGKRVLDFGCGSGLVGIAAKTYGAARVVCCDQDEAALVAARLNAELNGVAVEVARDAPSDIDLVAAGDVFYDEAVASAALEMLQMYAARGAEIWVGDIGRTHLPHERLIEVARYRVRDVGSVADAVESAGVFRYKL